MKKFLSVVLVAAMTISSAISVFGATGYETVKELTFDDATGITSFTSSWVSDDKYNFVTTDAPVAGGAFKPNYEKGAIVNGTFDGTKGFKITATVAFPEAANAQGAPWFASLATIADIALVADEEKATAFNSYSINSNGSATGFQMHAHQNVRTEGDGHSWGGDGAALEFGKNHVVTMTVLPNDSETVTITMTVDGEEYAIPNGNGATIPNYLSNTMTVIAGSSMYGDDYMYDILDLKIEKVVDTENPVQTGDVTSVIPVAFFAVASVVIVVAMKKKAVME